MIVEGKKKEGERIDAYRKAALHLNYIADRLEIGWVLDKQSGDVGSIGFERDVIEYTTWDQQAKNIGFDRVVLSLDIGDEWVKSEDA